MSWRPRAGDEPLGASSRYDSHNLTAFLEDSPNTRFIFVQWIDFMGQMRSRCLPIAEFTRLIRSGKSFAISYGNLGTLQNDHLSPVCNPVGSIFVEPDMSFASLRPMYLHGPIKDAATVMARFVDNHLQSLDLCPRAALQATIAAFREEYHINFLVGFEIEITFCRRGPHQSGDSFAPMDTIHAWSTFSVEQYTEAMPLMLSLATALQEIGIDIQQLHSESGAGQYEFVLPPLPPVYAIDTLVQTRQCIMQVAATHGLRATCHAQPFEGIGTAAHAHISLNSSVRHDLEQAIESQFVAAVLESLSALCAVTMPQSVSYTRVVDDSWTSGTWIAWGTQNREVPLRKSGQLRWEIRCLDGFANMYLALHAILSAGLLGLRDDHQLTLGDCTKNPSQLATGERQALGITRKLPSTIDEAMAAAWADEKLHEAMSPGILGHYLHMKAEEQRMLDSMEEKERRLWLMERY